MATAVAASRSPLSLAAARSPFAVPSHLGSHAGHRGLSHWMRRVLDELGTFRSSPDADTAHDLRVAIRRCRSLAAVMEEVDPDPVWPRIRRVPRRLFKALGAYRDGQVMKGWIEKLIPEGDPLRTHLLAAIEAEETSLSNAAQRAAAKFDDKEWADLERQARKRLRLVPTGGPTAECLGLERFEEAKELHSRALRSEKAKPWHALRIGLKRFRYTAEGFLPAHYAAWSDNLKRIQDLLGDIHDLDVFREKLEGDESIEETDSRKQCLGRAKNERAARVETYRQLTLGKTSLWNEWRYNLPHGKRLDAATAARIRSMARACDAHPRRTTQDVRMAVRLFDILGRVKAAPLFCGAGTRRALETAAKLEGVGTVRGHARSQKGIRKYLLGLTVPPNWRAADWDLMAWTARFHRGAEPKEKNGFAKLSEERQAAVRALAGVLRLARGLRKAGIETTRGLRPEKSADAIILRVPGLADTAECAAHLAAAKHLLELALPKPLVLQPTPAVAKTSAAAEEAPEATPVLASA